MSGDKGGCVPCRTCGGDQSRGWHRHDAGYERVVAELLAEYGLTELPPAFLCRYDGAVHKRGTWHVGDTPLVPATRVIPPGEGDG